MGKYMRKAKITGDVAVMGLSQPSFGVRTRAKTLALQKLRSATESTYLQLRSRRLEKLLPSFDDAKQQQQRKQQELKHVDCSGQSASSVNGRNPNSRAGSRLGPGQVKSEEEVIDGFTTRGRKENETEDNNDFGDETSFGENNPDFESRERSTRESTPCSLIKGSDTSGTPGSTTRLGGSSTTIRRNWNFWQSDVPTTHEMEEFFSCPERLEQKLFTDKYNFDVVNDVPLPGRYEWVRVDP